MAREQKYRESSECASMLACCEFVLDDASRLHLLYESKSGFERSRYVFLEYILVRMMTDAARTPHEKHRGRNARSNNHRVVTGAAGHAMHRQTALGNRLFECGDHAKVHRHGGLIDRYLVLK